MSAHERVGVGWRAVLAILERLPQGALSRGLGRIADLHIPVALRRPVYGAFARMAGIDVAETPHPLNHFESFDAFFTRPLREGSRAWPAESGVAGSPVDGVVGQFGEIRDGMLVQAKGRQYGAADLLADPERAASYDGGVFLTVYLSPRHYHRIHAPLAGAIVEARHVPGALLPVNEPAVHGVDALFPRNERLIVQQEGALGGTAVVAVGAYNVGRITAAFDPTWGGNAYRGGVTNRPAVTRPGTRRYAPPITVARGQEIMAFHLGSTVVLLFEPGVALSRLTVGAEIRLGAPIARRADGARASG